MLDLLPGAPGERAKAAEKVQTRIASEDLKTLEKAIADGRVKLTLYAFLQKAIQEAIRALNK